MKILKKKTESEYFERTTASLLQREKTNKIKEKTKTSVGSTTKPVKKKPKKLNKIE